MNPTEKVALPSAEKKGTMKKNSLLIHLFVNLPDQSVNFLRDL